MARVLVVEDNPLNMELMVNLLELNGYNVTQAEDGIEAFKRIKGSEYDLILLDIQLPKMDG
jgi:two-component system cell cycle response regulator DivK